LEPRDCWVELFTYYTAAEHLDDLVQPSIAFDSTSYPNFWKDTLNTVERLQKDDDVVSRWLDPYLDAAERRPWWREYFASRRVHTPAAAPSAGKEKDHPVG
jgi:hypothetical protein